MLPGLETALPALGSLGSLFGGGTRTSVSQSTNVSLAVNPIIANQYGDGGFTGSTSGNASGYPTSNANSSGNEGTTPSGYSYGSAGYGTTGYGTTAYGTATTQPVSDSGLLLPLLAGGALLLLTLFND